jgi:hypothetical protein
MWFKELFIVGAYLSDQLMSRDDNKPKTRSITKHYIAAMCKAFSDYIPSQLRDCKHKTGSQPYSGAGTLFR